MNITTNNSTTFQAKLNVSALGKHKVYWETIAEKFEKQTSRIPNAKIEIYPHCIQYVNTDSMEEGCFARFKNDYFTKSFLNNPENKIINSLTKFLEITHTAFNKLKEAENLAHSMEKFEDKIKAVPTYNYNVFDRIYTTALDVTDNYIKYHQKNDDILKKWKIDL